MAPLLLILLAYWFYFHSYFDYLNTHFWQLEMAFAFMSCNFILDLRVDGKVAYFISEDYLNCWMLKAALCKKMTAVLNESPCSNDINPLPLFQPVSLNHNLSDVTWVWRFHWVKKKKKKNTPGNYTLLSDNWKIVIRSTIDYHLNLFSLKALMFFNALLFFILLPYQINFHLRRNLFVIAVIGWSL